MERPVEPDSALHGLCTRHSVLLYVETRVCIKIVFTVTTSLPPLPPLPSFVRNYVRTINAILMTAKSLLRTANGYVYIQ